MTFWERLNYGDNKEINGSRGKGRRIFRAVKILCTDAIMMDIRHYTFIQTHKCITPRMKPKGNSGLWVIMCQCHSGE